MLLPLHIQNERHLCLSDNELTRAEGKPAHDVPIQCIARDYDTGFHIVSCDEEGILHHWFSHTVIRTIQDPRLRNVVALAVTTYHSRGPVVAALAQRTLHFYELRDGTLLQSLPLPHAAPPIRHLSFVRDLLCSESLACFCERGSMQIAYVNSVGWFHFMDEFLPPAMQEKPPIRADTVCADEPTAIR